MVDLCSPLRHVTFHAQARPDLSEWLGHARALSATIDTDVVLHCRYEIAVATLRGTNTLRPADGFVEAFYADLLASEVDRGLLEDIIVVGQYCLGASVRRLTVITTERLAVWHQAPTSSRRTGHSIRCIR